MSKKIYWTEHRLWADARYQTLETALADGCVISGRNGRGEPTEVVKYDCAYNSDCGVFNTYDPHTAYQYIIVADRLMHYVGGVRTSRTLLL